MSAGSGTGLAKLILCGEHAVVYGHPALAMAVELATTVTVEKTAGALQIVGIEDPRLEPAVRRVVGDGHRVTITSSVPIGRGMGSSAALAVGLVRAVAALNRERLDGEQCFERAFRVERVFHGNPSGVDHAVSARGGLVFYQRGPPLMIEDRLAPNWEIVVLDTGVAGDTAKMVGGVAHRRPAVDDHLQAIGQLVGQVDGHLQTGGDMRTLGAMLDENQRLLREIGVSNERIEALCAVARQGGAWGAKLAGAGGGGVVIALGPDPAAIVAAAARQDIRAFQVHIAPRSE